MPFIFEDDLGPSRGQFISHTGVYNLCQIRSASFSRFAVLSTFSPYLTVFASFRKVTIFLRNECMMRVSTSLVLMVLTETVEIL